MILLNRTAFSFYLAKRKKTQRPNISMIISLKMCFRRLSTVNMKKQLSMYLLGIVTQSILKN